MTATATAAVPRRESPRYGGDDVVIGQYYDEETGLHYNGARYYDPNLGRYTTVDPIDDKSGMSPYVYAANNPLRFVDPDGRLRVSEQTLQGCKGDRCILAKKLQDVIGWMRTRASMPTCQAYFNALGYSIEHLLRDGFGPAVVASYIPQPAPPLIRYGQFDPQQPNAIEIDCRTLSSGPVEVVAATLLEELYHWADYGRQGPNMWLHTEGEDFHPARGAAYSCGGAP